jgi:DNA primase
MPLIARRSIDQISRQINIYDVVSQVVTLKKVGTQYQGLSPFTQEKTPSFYINPEKNVFYCYSSAQGGNVIRFVQLYEKLSFTEAVQALAERFQIPLEYEQTSQQDSAQSPTLRKELLQINDQATHFFHQELKSNNQQAHHALRYWIEHRKFPLQLAEKFKIGYAPIHNNKLIEELIKKNYTLKVLKQCGLFYFAEKENDPRRLQMRFQGRLIIPIRNYQGQVIAFTARALDITPTKHSSKYINSPETPLFHKSETIFGLDVARSNIQTQDQNQPTRFILVEGQLDALRCWQYGINTAVAPQGTAITQAQLYLLKRYTDRIDCVLDGDNAGQKAALRMLPIALKVGHEVRFISLPSNKDPDSLLLENGLETFKRLQENAQTAMQFATQALLPKKNPSAQDISNTLKHIFEILSACEQEDLRQNYLKEAGRHLNLLDFDDRAINKQFRQYLYRKEQSKQKFIPLRQEKEQELIKPRLTTSEYELFLCIIYNEELGKRIAQLIDSEWIDTTTIYGKLLRRIIAEFQEGLWEGLERIEYLLDTEEEKNSVYSLLAEEPKFDNSVERINNIIQALVNKYVEKCIKQLQRKIEKLPTPSEKFSHYHKQIVKLRQLKQNIPTIQNLTV